MAKIRFEGRNSNVGMWRDIPEESIDGCLRGYLVAHPDVRLRVDDADHDDGAWFEYQIKVRRLHRHVTRDQWVPVRAGQGHDTARVDALTALFESAPEIETAEVTFADGSTLTYSMR